MVGANIKEARKKLGITQAELAIAIGRLGSTGVDFSVISRIESGKKDPTEFLQNIATVLRTTIEELKKDGKGPLRIGLAYTVWAAPLLKMCISKDNIPNVKICFYSYEDDPYWHYYSKDNKQEVRLNNFESAYKTQNISFEKEDIVEWNKKDLKKIELYTVTNLVELLGSDVLDLIAIPAETGKKYSDIVRVGSVAQSYMDAVQFVFLKKIKSKDEKEILAKEFDTESVKTFEDFYKKLGEKNISTNPLKIILPANTIAEEHLRTHGQRISPSSDSKLVYEFYPINNWIKFTSHVDSELRKNKEIGIMTWEPYSTWLKARYDNNSVFYYDTFLQESYNFEEKQFHSSTYDIYLKVSNVEAWAAEGLLKDFLIKLHAQCNSLNDILAENPRKITTYSDVQKLAKFTDMEITRFITILKKFKFGLKFDANFIFNHIFKLPEEDDKNTK